MSDWDFKIFTGTEVVWSFKEMPNGETRISARSPDGTRRITTIASGKGGWQVGHFHKGMSEEYTVQKGFMVLAYLCPFKKRETWRPVLIGEKVLIPPPEPHNVWLSPGGIFLLNHVVYKDETHPYFLTCILSKLCFRS